MRALAIGPLIGLALAGCDEGEKTASEEPTSVVATSADTEVHDWLAPTDPMDTGRWLASRELKRLVATDDPASAQMRRSLARAKPFFVEDPRMIANRTVQLGQMLAETGQKEGYEALIEGLTRIAQGTHGKQLYGDMCHHYFNTRAKGADRTASLSALAERYGAKTQETQP